MALAQLRLHQSLGVAHAAQAPVADVGLAGHQRHRHAVAQLALAQVRVEDEGELVHRAEAARALDRADHDRARVLEEFPVGLPRALRVVDRADRLGVALGAEPRDLLEGQPGPGADDEVVVGHAFAGRGGDRARDRVDRLRRAADEADAAPGKAFAGGQRGLRRLAPTRCDPGVRGREGEALAIADHGDRVGVAQGRAEFVGGAHAADPCAQDHDAGHSAFLRIVELAASSRPRGTACGLIRIILY
jgi:hypothetical protein